MLRSGLQFLVSALIASTAPAPGGGAALATIPKYEHVVVVVMENHQLAQVIGHPAAPYLTSLARQGANFTNSHGIGHPSQPNYLALFSGSTQGVLSDRCPQTFATENNLGAQLIAAGFSFIGFSEGLPVPGFTGCKAGHYARKHNPWVNFASVPAPSNQPYTAFPADFETLPTLSFVIPDMVNDMHDSSVKVGDAWLAAHVDAYAQWAKTHNSLLIVTFDEDDYATVSNLIPTVMVGANIVPGDYAEEINHYRVLATLENMFKLAPLTPAAPITAAFAAAIYVEPPAAPGPAGEPGRSIVR